MATSDTSTVVDRSPVSFGAWLGIVLLFIVFGLVVLVLIGLSPRGDTYEARRARDRVEVLKKLQDEANTQLHSYGWIDKDKGVARIPIDRAMELTVADLAKKTPAPANPIESLSPAAGSPSAASPGASPQQSQAAATGSPQAKAAQSASPAGTSQSPTASATVTASGTPKPKAVQGADSENRNQPAGAANPPNAPPGTQPGASVTPAATPTRQAAVPPVSPTVTPVQSPAGTPIPVAGKTPP